MAYKAVAPAVDVPGLAAVKGSEFHSKLEDQAYKDFDLVAVEFDNRQEDLAFKLLNCLSAIGSLLAGHTPAAREIYVIGWLKHNRRTGPAEPGLYMRGIIDSIVVVNPEDPSASSTMIVDEKTKVKKLPPHPSQAADYAV